MPGCTLPRSATITTSAANRSGASEGIGRERPAADLLHAVEDHLDADRRAAAPRPDRPDDGDDVRLRVRRPTPDDGIVGDDRLEWRGRPEALVACADDVIVAVQQDGRRTRRGSDLGEHGGRGVRQLDGLRRTTRPAQEPHHGSCASRQRPVARRRIAAHRHRRHRDQADEVLGQVGQQIAHLATQPGILGHWAASFFPRAWSERSHRHAWGLAARRHGRSRLVRMDRPPPAGGDRRICLEEIGRPRGTGHRRTVPGRIETFCKSRGVSVNLRHRLSSSTFGDHSRALVNRRKRRRALRRGAPAPTAWPEEPAGLPAGVVVPRAVARLLAGRHHGDRRALEHRRWNLGVGRVGNCAPPARPPARCRDPTAGLPGVTRRTSRTCRRGSPRDGPAHSARRAHRRDLRPSRRPDGGRFGAPGSGPAGSGRGAAAAGAAPTGTAAAGACCWRA